MKRQVPSHHLEKHSSQRPHISQAVVGLLKVDLWRHVERSSTNCLLEQIHVRLDLRLPKVSNFKLKLVCCSFNQDIFEFNVSVHDFTLTLHKAQSSQDVLHNATRLTLIEPLTLYSMRLDVSLQVRVTKLHEQKSCFSPLYSVIELHYVRMSNTVLKSDFTIYLLRSFITWYYFAGKLLPRHVLCLKNLAIGAFADLL